MFLFIVTLLYLPSTKESREAVRRQAISFRRLSRGQEFYAPRERNGAGQGGGPMRAATVGEKCNAIKKIANN
ncbi:MAG: hypothetical protein ABI845_08545, partial [Polaromonas sp.]